MRPECDPQEKPVPSAGEAAPPPGEDRQTDFRCWLGRAWVAACVLWTVAGARCGLNPVTIMVTPLLLGLPPAIGAIVSSHCILRRTKTAHPDAWDRLRLNDWTGLEMRFFLTDPRDLGDPDIRREKGRLRRWLLAGMLAMALYLPSLFLFHVLGD